MQDNTIGLKQSKSWSDMSTDAPLVDQLDQQQIAHVEIVIPNLVGLGGSAYLCEYTSPATGKAVTVLCVPIRYEIDGFAEDYYYFEGLALDDAQALDWIDLYDACRELTKGDG